MGALRYLRKATLRYWRMGALRYLRKATLRYWRLGARGYWRKTPRFLQNSLQNAKPKR
jgi:hypothetical protein